MVTSALPKIRVLPDARPLRTSQIYAGLCDLHHQGAIRLSFLKRPPPEIAASHEMSPNTLWVEADFPAFGRTLKLCFDVRDSPEITARTRFRACDVYIKRSYSQAYLATLQPDLRDKVIPYGLHYNCRSQFERLRLGRWLHYFRAFRQYPDRTAPSHQLKRLTVETLRIWLPSRVVSTLGVTDYPAPAADFEVAASEPAEPCILFQTRAWVPPHGRDHDGSIAAEFAAVNDFRARTIRALRRAFPDRFVGGFAPTEFAKSTYPDCLTTMATGQDEFRRLVKESLITLTTSGLRGSIGWKVPEYLAASRCIVTEPLNFTLPVPLEEGVNLLTFETPEACVERCQRLLEDEKFAQQMRVNNELYYRRWVRPQALVAHCLDRSLAHVAAETLPTSTIREPA